MSVNLVETAVSVLPRLINDTDPGQVAVASFDEVKFDKLMGKWIVICPERKQQMSIYTK